MSIPKPFDSFENACGEVLTALKARLGFRLWMVTRTESRDWIVLHANDDGYNVVKGDVFCWADSFCSRMVEGTGPRIAPQSQMVPAYAEAPIGRQVPISAYIGIPLNRSDGRLFGTLCAIDPEPKSDELVRDQPLVELMGRLLMSILESELREQSHLRRAERAENESMLDALTGIFNRRGWDSLLATEEQRCRRYGHPACVISIDLDDLKAVNDHFGHTTGDQMIRSAADTISNAVRDSDVVARLGGDEFAVLAVECDENQAEAVVQRLAKALADSEVTASVGMAMRCPKATLYDAYSVADTRMYARKAERKAKTRQNQPSV